MDGLPEVGGGIMVRSLAHVRVRANHALSRRNVFPTPLSPVMMFRREPKLNVNFGAKPRFSRISCSSIATTMIGHQRCANKLQQRRGYALIWKIGVHGKPRTARPFSLRRFLPENLNPPACVFPCPHPFCWGHKFEISTLCPE